jgi:aerobic-type carbon monoxide dehydrogenase small subunit (CoxS/CutS family)
MTTASEALARPTIQISLKVNGRPYDLTIEPRETLLEVLRNRLGLTGTKLSCDVQVCGACTVLLDDLPVSACTLLAYEARGREVLTIEGLADGDRLHPLQQAFIDHAALQCGSCTPGMILAAKSLLDERQHLPVHRVQEDPRSHHRGRGDYGRDGAGTRARDVGAVTLRDGAACGRPVLTGADAGDLDSYCRPSIRDRPLIALT